MFLNSYSNQNKDTREGSTIEWYTDNSIIQTMQECQIPRIITEKEKI